MRFYRKPAILLAVGLAFVAVFILLSLLGRTQPALAHGLDREANERVSQAPAQQQQHPTLIAVVVFTDPAVVDIFDVTGNFLGEGIHTGELSCKNDNCNRAINLDLLMGSGRILYKYQFKSVVAVDPEGGRVSVAGTGTIYSGAQKARFFFTATFENNWDGTVAVTYVASRPDASFRIPASPGTFSIETKTALKIYSK